MPTPVIVIVIRLTALLTYRYYILFISWWHPASKIF